MARTESPQTLAIEARGLAKRFGGTRAIDGVDLEVQRGAVYGVLGPNGAGKTTTLRMLATLVRPDAGRATVLGHDIVRDADAVRGCISLTGQFASVDQDLTGRENLMLLARLLGLSRADARTRSAALLDAFGLGDAARRTVRTYSGGMRRRLDIAASVVVRPDVLFLDEPTTGLDPRSRNQVWDVVRMLAAAGTTVLLTTQYLDEADQLADRVAVIDRGRVVAEGAPARLKSTVGAGTLRLRVREPAERDHAVDVLAAALGVEVARAREAGAMSARLDGPEHLDRALAALRDAGIVVAEVAFGQPSLDEVFLAITGHPTAADDASAAEEAA
jgi:ABC-2 type transport system ATP-binding protein